MNQQSITSSGEPMIEFRSITKSYNAAAAAVRDLSISIDAGAITVFVGPSGCGKTTSLRMINRMVVPTEGQVIVDGEDIADKDPAVLRRGMGYVMQQAGLLPHRTVLDNVATVPRLLGESKRQARANARELINRVGLAPELANRYPAQLSGGQQQRVGVARALAANPPILLMDEPFSAVDPVVRAELQDELLRLQQELAKTIVFVTHDIDEATVLGDKVAVFAVGGRLAQYDTPEALLRAPVDDFVAGFVGRDRGFRHLSFASGEPVPVHPLVTLRRSEQDGWQVSEQDWRLITDDDEQPLGWLAPGGTRDDGLESGGSLFKQGDSMRRALDAALSSPSGRGVAVDTAGCVVGVVDAHEILDLIETARRRENGRKPLGLDESRAS